MFDHLDLELLEQLAAEDARLERRLRELRARVQKQQQHALVRKTFINDPQPAQQHTTMDAETSARWNEWFDARINLWLDKYDGAVTRLHDQLVDDLERENDMFLAEIKALRTRVSVLEDRLALLDDGKVAPIRGKSNAA